jgi:microcystin-dependent protein
MAQPYVGEIRMFGGNFAPLGWALCDGSLMAISENDALFFLIGTTYGGDGQETFGLPDLRGRVPIHQGTNSGTTFQLGERGGDETVTLSTAQIPNHTHFLLPVGVQGDQVSPSNTLPANSFNVTPYVNESPNNNMNAGAVQPFGGGQPHENRQPYLAITFIISLFGIFPSQT